MKTKEIVICFENCDDVSLGIEHDVKATLSVDTENFYGEMSTLKGKGDVVYNYNYYTHSLFSTKYARIEFNNSALIVPTRMDSEQYRSTLGSRFKDKDITHIDVMTEDGESHYIAVPWFSVNATLDTYNMYQKEFVENGKTVITFEKKNLWGNLPRGISWYILHNIMWYLHSRNMMQEARKRRKAVQIGK